MIFLKNYFNEGVAMEELYRNLLEISKKDHEKYGGKTVNTAELLKRGYRVPEGFGLSVSCFESFCKHNGMDPSSSDLTEGELDKNHIPEAIEGVLEILWESFMLRPDEALVIRSSAVGEDGESRAYAGIYESFLNIRTCKDLKEGVKRCWNSYFSDRARFYRSTNTLEGSGMGVLIQKLVEGDKSGVLFTINPISGNREEMMVECHPGLNLAVVDGSTSVDRFLLDRKGKIVYPTINEKKFKYCTGQQSFVIDVAAIRQEEWGLPVLSSEEAVSLADIGARLEGIFGHPCDIEWTIREGSLYILQCRPVTVRNTTLRTKDVYFDCCIAEDVECTLLDRYSEPASTCYLSLLQSWESMVYLSFYTKREGRFYDEKPLLFYFNRVYWNLKYQREFFDDVAFNSPGVDNFRKKLKLFRLMMKGYKGWYKRLDRYERYVREYEECGRSSLTLEELGGTLKSMIHMFCNFIGKDHFQFLGLAQVSYNLLVKKLAALPDHKETIAAIIEAKVNKNMTMKSNSELLDLVRKAADAEEIRDIFMKEKAESIYARLSGSEIKERFRHMFDSFIAEHGHRGTSCDDLYTPHWVEEPSIVLELIKQFLTVSQEFDLDRRKEREAASDYNKAMAIYLAAAFKNPVRRMWEGKKIKVLMELATEYMALRENQRYYFDKSWVVIRKMILAVGGLLKQRHIIEAEKDVFHLTIDEIFDLCNPKTEVHEIDWKKSIESRKNVYIRSAAIIPPFFIKNGDLMRLQKKGVKSSFKAVGISPGKAVGPVRIIRSIKDLSRVKQGEIAVVSTFHPSWTPVLGIVSGLVMNYGNILSHGAVVAREYKIPVVVFNDAATQVLVEGMWIEIDGTNGRIRICDVEINKNNNRNEVSA